MIDTHPLGRKVKPLKLDSPGMVRYLSDDEERRLRNALRERDTLIRARRASANQWRSARDLALLDDLFGKAYADHLEPIVLLTVNTGLRRGELFNLQWRDINVPGRMLTVRGAGAKSGETRHIPLNNEAHDVLKCWQEQSKGDGYVFPAADGGRLDNVKKAWTGLLDAAQISNFRFHDLRHHFASRLVMAGVDLNAVRELMGHADLKMTLRYAHLAPEHKAAAVAMLNRDTNSAGRFVS